ncbi:EthD family reductase [Ramlibacter sp.]|jgi:uncharacterized protein (TIGR02118 family)|uniref:EthD family reductase n=1 Tax=Ramlibacter sp. TaxID=1917967 RepID=UPI00261DF94F|nr:EthD family reductase [Ramlibacter sp.]MDB5956140.1 Ethyl tert-butyl ether degradation EthD [Ramlibacter sp.]
MIKVSVLYPQSAGARFDHAYYRDRHMPMVKDKLGGACLHYTVDQGVAGGAPGAPAPFTAMCHIYCKSLPDFQQAMEPNAQAIMADVANYTDIQPVFQISEVVVEQG